MLINTYTVISNPRFFVQHRDDLLPVIFSALNAWAASEELIKSDRESKKMGAHVLKSQYQDVFYRVAFLVGGYEHAACIDKKWRSYDFES